MLNKCGFVAWQRQVRACLLHLSRLLTIAVRGGGTSGEPARAENATEIVGYAKRTNGGIKEVVRGAQIISIFGVTDGRSDFFSEFFPALTA